MTATYVRGSGPHIAERVRPAPGSDEETALAALADDPASGWSRIDDQPPAEPARRPAKSASKADWVAYAVTQGATEADATAATRDELAALYEDGDA